MTDTPSRSFVIIGADGRTEVTISGDNVSYGERGVSITDHNGRAVAFFPYDNILGFHTPGSAKIVRH